MRTLLLFRGAPGCGKSTYIKNHGLEQYTLSADEIRMQCSSPVQATNGSLTISQKQDKLVWETLFKMLETRMQNGCFTVIDATNSKTSEMNRYKALAKQYRYRIYVVDMTDLPIAECKRRNASRLPMKQVPESVIDKMYARFATQKIPAGIKVLTRDNAIAEISYKKSNLDQYKAVHVIGDIHGCNTCLQQYLSDIGGIQDDEMYIFCGDYIDRGLENVQVIQFLLSIMDKPNVILLEGNHECWLYKWSHEQNANSRDFEQFTRKELDAAGIDKKAVSRLYQRLHQCAWFSFQGQDYFVCHGGIAKFDTKDPLALIKIPTHQMVHGVGKYEDLPGIIDSWHDSDTIHIFGHRNIQDYPILPDNSKCCLLEGHIEFGGCLRGVELVSGSTIQHETPNTVFRQPEEKPLEIKHDTPVADLVEALRKDRDVRESKFGNISAFNFTSQAFKHAHWNERTTLARGLFIDTAKDKIVARGYEKFFRIDELRRIHATTSLDYLKANLKFPVEVYRKENGYLGLLSYDADNDDLRFCSKGSIGGDYAENFRRIFTETWYEKDSYNWNRVKETLRDSDSTYLYEVIDPVKDPHIIEYNSQHLVLLDKVKNQIKFSKTPYKELAENDADFFLAVKEHAATLNTWQEFLDFYTKASMPGYKYGNEYIEGFVFEDAAGFMTKLKTDYYSKWKHMRSVADSVRRWGYIQNTAQLTDAVENAFYGFLREKYNQDENFRNYKQQRGYDIITLRKQFFAERGEPV